MIPLVFFFILCLPSASLHVLPVLCFAGAPQHQTRARNSERPISPPLPKSGIYGIGVVPI